MGAREKETERRRSSNGIRGLLDAGCEDNGKGSLYTAEKDVLMETLFSTDNYERSAKG